ncbi:MAG TPA: pyridoxamine 5'-phosphate oxidase family protein [Propionibacteriaceae bacterium]|nr:pyridoxamine 5'-phosphate oxidase family protein [Propionibacteriaceae bacterium]
MADSNEVAKLIELTRDIKISMFTTIDEEGHFVSRPMAQQLVEPDGDIWLFAERDSRVVEQLTANSHVGMTLSSSDTWISIDGSAEMVEDQAKKDELWNSWVEAWLPDGQTDPNVVLIKVDPHSAEYWDTPGGRVASLLSFVKAKVTGEPYDGAEQARVEL